MKMKHQTARACVYAASFKRFVIYICTLFTQASKTCFYTRYKWRTNQYLPFPRLSNMLQKLN